MAEIPTESNSPWREVYHQPYYPSLQGQVTADVIVIGAGIAGLTTAYLLQQSGLSVVILEKQTIGSGATGYTTGKVTSQHGLTYTSLIKHHDKETARLYGESNQAALALIDEISSAEKIDCDWIRDDNYVFTTEQEQVDTFKDEAKLAQELGLPAHFETVTPLPFPVAAAVRFSNQGKIHSVKYLLGLAAALKKRGGQIFEESAAISIRDGSPAVVKTRDGKVTGKHIVVTTQVPTFPLVARGGYALLEYPTESYGVAGTIGTDLTGMYISTDKNHYSLLPYNNGKERTLVVVGAGGNIPHFRGKESAEDRQRKLADYAERYFRVSEWKYRWAEYDYMAYDDLPIVGRLYPWSDNMYVATAFRKWGLSNGTVAAMVLRDRILDKYNPWSGLYDSTRWGPVASIPRTISNYFKR